jgi:UDPglucose 6-dehydrogenase
MAELLKGTSSLASHENQLCKDCRCGCGELAGLHSMRIVMIGAGYVGLVSGACMADLGHEVLCVDTDEGKIAALRTGRVPIYEPGLSELVLANRGAGRLLFTTSLKEAGRGAKAIFIAVGTPSLAEVGADMHFLVDAARAIADVVEDFVVVVVKSTANRRGRRGVSHHR